MSNPSAGTDPILAAVLRHQRFWGTLFYGAAAASIAAILADRVWHPAYLGTLGWWLAVAAVWGGAGLCLVPVIGALVAERAGVGAWPAAVHRLANRGARTLSALGILSMLLTGLEPRAVAVALPLTAFAVWAAYRIRRLAPAERDGGAPVPGQTAQLLAIVALVVMAIGGLARLSTFASTKAGAYAAAMRADLRNLFAAQEDFFSEQGHYSRDAIELDFEATRMTVGPSIRLTDDGWTATVAHEALDGTCHVFAGSTPNPPATEAGRVVCTGLPSTRRSAVGGFLLFASTQVLLLGFAIGIVYPVHLREPARPAPDAEGIGLGQDRWVVFSTRARRDHDRWSRFQYVSVVGFLSCGALAVAFDSVFLSGVAVWMFWLSLITALAIFIIPGMAALAASFHHPDMTVPPRLRRSAIRAGAIVTGVGVAQAALGGRAVWWLAAPAVALGLLMMRGADQLATDPGIEHAVKWRRAPYGIAGGVLLVATLMAFAPDFGYPRVMAYYMTLRADMRNLVTTQEVFFSEFVRFSRSAAELGFEPSTGVIGPTIAMTPTGWTAVARHELIPTACYVFVGSTPVGVATQEGEVACTARPTGPKAPGARMASFGSVPILALALLFGFGYMRREG